LKAQESPILNIADIPDADARMLISTQLTKIFLLLGRLQPDYNPRYLPVTVSSILFLVNELDQLEKKVTGFSGILKENIELRQRSEVFFIPKSLLASPDCQGLRTMLFELTNILIKSFCTEEKKFLSEGINPQISSMVRFTLLMRTEKNCKLLAALCGAENWLQLNELKRWCKSEMLGYQ
jgi:hypothetical protein